MDTYREEQLQLSINRTKFLGTLREKRGNRQLLIFLEWCNLGFIFLGSRRKERIRN